MSELTLERIKEVISYDPATGEFRWRVSLSQCTRPGALAGGTRNDGYRVVRIDRHNYMLAHIAWFLMTGEMHIGRIKQIDGDPSNLRWTNLRAMTTTRKVRKSRPKPISVKVTQGRECLLHGMYLSIERAVEEIGKLRI